MTAECKSTRKRAYPDENTDVSAPASPRKREAAGSSVSSAAASNSTSASSENTPEPYIIRSPYFSPPKKAQDNARKRRLLAASHSLLNENSRFVKRPSGVASPAEVRGRDRKKTVTEHLVSELSKAKPRKRKTRVDPGLICPGESNELPVEKSNLTALEQQVLGSYSRVRSSSQTNHNRYQE